MNKIKMGSTSTTAIKKGSPIFYTSVSQDTGEQYLVEITDSARNIYKLDPSNIAKLTKELA